MQAAILTVSKSVAFTVWKTEFRQFL